VGFGCGADQGDPFWFKKKFHERPFAVPDFKTDLVYHISQGLNSPSR
jgi:hypothetical protein